MAVIKYSAEQEKELYDNYLDADTEEQRLDVILKYQTKHNKSKRSVIAKLSKLGIYKSKAKVSTVTGSKPETKEQLVKRIEEKFDWVGLEGLEKAPKLTLLKMLK